MGSSFLSRTMVFIDGHYLEKEIRDKKISDKLDEGLKYQNIPNFLVRQSVRGDMRPQLARAYYYNALPNLKDLEKIKDEKAREKIKLKMEDIIKKNEPKFDSINALDMFEVRLGRLVFSENGDIRQKGVDSLIAIDMLTKAFRKDCDEVILLAGDSDFVEVVKATKNAGINVTGAYFENSISKELIHSFDKKIVLDNYDFIRNDLLE